MYAVLNMAVFCSSLTSWFPGKSLTYFVNDLEAVPVAPIITGITLFFTFHMGCISLWGLYILKTFRIIILLLLLLLLYQSCTRFRRLSADHTYS